MPETAPPATIYAGDSAAWTFTDSRYPSPTWEAKCVFQRVGQDPVQCDATADGSGGHSFAMPTSKSAGMAAGEWVWAVRVTDASEDESAIAASSSTIVFPDPAATTRTESHAETCLTLVKAQLEGRLVDGQESFSMLGQDITKIPATDLIALKDHYQSQVNHERRRENARRGGRSGRSGVAGSILFGKS